METPLLLIRVHCWTIHAILWNLHHFTKLK
jgi:hypothetical protein